MSESGERQSSTYGMRCDLSVTRCGVHDRRVADVCCMWIGQMVKSGVGQGVMRNKGGLCLILVARAYTTIRVRTLALWDAVHLLSTVFVARGTVSRCSRWRRRRGVGSALGDGDAGIPWVVGTASICRREVGLVSVTLLCSSRREGMEGSKGGGEVHVRARTMPTSGTGERKADPQPIGNGFGCPT